MILVGCRWNGTVSHQPTPMNGEGRVLFVIEFLSLENAQNRGSTASISMSQFHRNVYIDDHHHETRDHDPSPLPTLHCTLVHLVVDRRPDDTSTPCTTTTAVHRTTTNSTNPDTTTTTTTTTKADATITATAAVAVAKNVNVSTSTTTTPPPPLTIHEWFALIEDLYDPTNTPIAQTAPPPVPPLLSFSTAATAVSSVWEQTKFQILQYVQNKDRCINLTSVLLKSYAYYENCNTQYHSSSSLSSSSHQPRTRPIMILPRTSTNQPYIPHTTPTVSTSLFSISHQYPVVGLVQQQPPPPQPHPHPNAYRENYTDSEYSNNASMVGMDIVIFEAHYNPKLYRSLMEYIHVYEDYFTPYEWHVCMRIPPRSHQHHRHTHDSRNTTVQNDDTVVLHEFYLQWSIKEAYTKALGCGMNIDFQSFHTRIDRSTGRVIRINKNDTHHHDDIDEDTATPQEQQNDLHRHYHNTGDNNHGHNHRIGLWEWIRQQYYSTIEVESPSTRSTHHAASSGSQHQPPPPPPSPQRQHFVVGTIGTVTQVSSTPPDRNSNAPLQSPRPEKEKYYFYFYPIFQSDDGNNSNYDSNDINGHDDMIGCASICYGPISTLPLPIDHETASATLPFPNLHIQYTSLQQLVEYHHTSPTDTMKQQ